MVLFQKTSDTPNVRQQIPAEAHVHPLLEHTWQLHPANTLDARQPQLREIKSAILPEAEIPLHTLPRADKALALYVLGKYAEVTEILQHDDLTSEEQILFIRAYANQGELDRALRSCAKAIEADKLNPGLHYLYATLLQENNRLDEAVASLKRAIYLDSNFVLSYYSLGTIYRRLGDVTSAKKCADNVLTILNTCSQDEILFESEGLTAGRFKEMVVAADQSRDLA
jgi:chemotaxis protein methyltransferase CheR